MWLDHGFHSNINAASSALGSISIACWMIAFTPQIIENYQKQSCSLSIKLILGWLTGDFFNITASIAQNVMPTMLLLAIYYGSVDVVLLCQYIHYEGFTLTDRVETSTSHERSALLPRQSYPAEGRQEISEDSGSVARALSPSQESRSPQYPMKPILSRLGIALFILSAGAIGWWFSDNGADVPDSGDQQNGKHRDELEYNTLGQVFGYICSTMYLSARVPQIILNYQRKSTHGVSMLFYMIATLANIALALSIFFYAPTCQKPSSCHPGEAWSLYWKHVGINAPWLLLSMGSMVLDSAVFVQFFLYRKMEDNTGMAKSSNVVDTN